MSSHSTFGDNPGALPHAGVPPQVAAVVAAIETDIIRGRILPRNRLIEDHLMEDYDAKRHVVRAALAELQRLGVVVKPPHLGANVRRFDENSLRALYHFRAVLHGAAVAAMPLPVAPERLAAVELAAQVHAQAATTGDLIAIHRANMAFHRLFLGCATTRIWRNQSGCTTGSVSPRAPMGLPTQSRKSLHAPSTRPWLRRCTPATARNSMHWR